MQEVDTAAIGGNSFAHTLAIECVRPVGNAVRVDLAAEDAHAAAELLVGSDGDSNGAGKGCHCEGGRYDGGNHVVSIGSFRDWLVKTGGSGIAKLFPLF